MGKGDELRRRGGLTSEQAAERLSTEGVSFKDSLRRGRAGRPEPDGVAEAMDDQEQRTRPLSDQEWRERQEREKARNADPNYANPLVTPPAYMRRAPEGTGGDSSE